MTGSIAVGNYRDSDSWKRARFAVCSALDFARTLSREKSIRHMANEIDTLSVSILDNMAKGFESYGSDDFFIKALDSVDRLDGALERVAEQLTPARTASRHLQRKLKTVRSALQRTPRKRRNNAFIRRKK
jgi:hypothetical protein